MKDYDCLSEAYNILTSPPDGLLKTQSDLKIVYQRLVTNHQRLSGLHSDAMKQLKNNEFWHVHFQKYHVFMEAGHKNLLEHL
jgi:hypothetical protein